MSMKRTISPQRHGDTEEKQIQSYGDVNSHESYEGYRFCLSLCLCVSVVDVLSWRSL